MVLCPYKMQINIWMKNSLKIKMKLKTIIPMILMLTFIFSISLISATVYQTPGYVAEPESVSPEVTVPEDVQEDSTNKIPLSWIILVGLSFIGGIFLVTKKRISKKRKKIENHSQRKKDDDLPIGNHLGPQLLPEEEDYIGECLSNEANHADTLNTKETEKIEEESDEMMKEIGLDEVEETKEGKEDEH